VVDTAPLPAGDALAAELVLAAPSLTHLYELKLFGFASQLQLLPSVAKMALLLRRLPDLRCVICCRRAASRWSKTRCFHSSNSHSNVHDSPSRKRCECSCGVSSLVAAQAMGAYGSCGTLISPCVVPACFLWCLVQAIAHSHV
jgi:hypothetical protein